MALDGFAISNLVTELKDKLINSRIIKISQPERDELILQIKNNGNTYRLFLSANASLPLIYLTNTNKQNPMIAPGFCMLLRKHLNSARIVDFIQPSLERIIKIKIEHLNELGDLSYKYLIIELMGKHSNIIFCDEENIIIDSIKHVSHMVSSIREVLPGREYFLPVISEKYDPFSLTYEDFKEQILAKPLPLFKAIYTSITGFSPLMANELCTRASLDSFLPGNTITEDECLHLFKNFQRLMEDVNDKNYQPNIIYEDGSPIEFSCFLLNLYRDYENHIDASISTILETYYASKNNITRIRQKSADLRKIVSNAIERSSKKLDLQLKQYKDTEKRDKFRIYGELINTYGYSVEPGAKKFKALNYYTNQEIEIPLDSNLTIQENSQKYFNKYNKLKRTYEALTSLIEETKGELFHLESIKNSLDIAVTEDDLFQLKEELMDYGFIKRKSNIGKKKKARKGTSKPFHYLSSDGFHLYVGKNNYQNDELTFQLATGNDWWFHAKNIPGSHVIIQTNDKEVPDRTFEEAARLAAYYSSARGSDKVEIDYTQKKNIKKPKGSKPGFVVYYTNYSMIVSSDIKDIKDIEDIKT